MNILEQIYQDKLIEVRNKKKKQSGEQLCRLIKNSQYQIKDFVAALENKISEQQPAIITEVKKASPSRGIIRQDFDPVKIAKIYEKEGAAAISVLTDEKYFMGKNSYLTEIRKNTNLPILRKDFIIDPYQIWEAKSIGADCILLIMAMLDIETALKLEEEAHKIGLAVLAEVHDEKELEMALKLKTRLIGINNRNLKTLKVDINNSKKLAPLIPDNKIVICESGISSKDNIEEMIQAKIYSFLVGESLMKQENIGLALRQLIS